MEISVLGCGWLGLPLGEQLRDADHIINGSTTSPQKIELLNGKNIEPFLLELDPQLKCENCSDFWDADLLVLNIPPHQGRDNMKSYHLQQIKAVINEVKASPIERLIFVSSTCVYPPKPGIVGEVDVEFGNASRNSGNALLEAEKLLLSQDKFDTTVIRFGGLYGYNRHPAKYLAGKKNMSGGNAPVNLIHRDDCVGIIQKIISENVTGEIFNGVSDGHPPKRMYYPAAAEALELEPPVFADDMEEGYKVVSNRKIKELLNYKFEHPNPMDAI